MKNQKFKLSDVREMFHMKYGTFFNGERMKGLFFVERDCVYILQDQCAGGEPTKKPKTGFIYSYAIGYIDGLKELFNIVGLEEGLKRSSIKFLKSKVLPKFINIDFSNLEFDNLAIYHRLIYNRTVRFYYNKKDKRFFTNNSVNTKGIPLEVLLRLKKKINKLEAVTSHRDLVSIEKLTGWSVRYNRAHHNDVFLNVGCQTIFSKDCNKILDRIIETAK